MAASDSLIQLPADGGGKKVRTRTGMNRATDTTTHQEIHTVAGPDGDMAGVTGYGFLQATGEPATLFYDPFDGSTIDTTHRWNAAIVSGAGAAVTQTNGTLTLAGGALINSYAYVTSKASFNAHIPGFLQVSFAIQLESGTAAVLNTQAHRFWGIGTSIAAPTPADPLTNAVGFAIKPDGKLYAVVESAGVETTAIDLSSTGTGIAASTMPSDGNPHRYLVQYRTDRVYWFIDGVMVAVGSFTSPEVQTLPLRHSWVNSSAIVGTMTYKVLGSVAADTGRNGFSIADGKYEWRQADVTDPASFDAAPLGSGWGTGPALNVNANAIKKRSYVASRVTADAGAPAAVTIVANTRKALLQVHHLSAATTTKKIRRITVGALFGAAVQYGYEVYRVTAAPTGGTALTPISADSGEAASGLVATYLPAAGTSGAISGIALAGATVLGAATGHGLITIYDWKASGNSKPLAIRKGVLEGFTLFVRGTGTSGPDPQIFIEYSEE